MKDIRAKFGITNLTQSLDIGQNSDGGISDLPISGQSLVNKLCHNSRTSHDTNMKLGTVIKLVKKNTARLKNFDDDVKSTNCDVIVFFPIYGRFAAIQGPDSGRMVYKTYVSNDNNLLSSKNWKQN